MIKFFKFVFVYILKKKMLICPSVGHMVIEKTRQFQTWNSFKLIAELFLYCLSSKTK